MNETKSNAGETINISTHLTRMAREQPYKRAVVWPAGRDKNNRVTYAVLKKNRVDHCTDQRNEKTR